MRRHVVRTFGIVTITRVILGGDALEEVSQVQHHVRIGVLLNHQRCRSVLDEQRQEAGFSFGRSHPRRHLASERIQTLSTSADFQNVVHLFDSDALGQIARLIDIATASYGNVIREHLQRHYFQNRQQQLMR